MMFHLDGSIVSSGVLRAFLAIGFAAGISGCSAEMGEANTDEVGSQAQELGEAACGTTTPDKTDYAYFAPDIVSPTTYDHPGCYKAYIVDLTTPYLNYTQTITSDTLAGTQAACEDQVVYFQPYRLQGSTFVAEGPKQRSQGSWSCGGQYCLGCTLPSFLYGASDSSTVRFAVSARSIATGATMPFRLSSYKNF